MNKGLLFLLPAILSVIIHDRCSGQKSTGLNNILPASPQATSIAQDYNYPVDYSTGIPDISIPLYDVKAGDVTLPIVLKYHPGSLKLNSLSGWVGLGWSLTAEPTITRSVNGSADEVTNGYLTRYNPEFGTFSDNSYLYDITQHQSFDEQADNFYYSLGSKGSGSFVFKRPVSTQAQGTRQAVLIPYENYRVSSSLDPAASNFLYSFSIVDNDGVTYNYGGRRDAIEITEMPGVSVTNTAWKATSIISQKNDTVQFAYDSLLPAVFANNFIYAYNDSYTLEDDPHATFYGGGALYCPLGGARSPFPLITKATGGKVNYFTVSDQSYDGGTGIDWLSFAIASDCYPANQTFNTTEGYRNNTKLLKTISFPGGRVEFHLNPNISWALSSIKVFNNNNVLIKEIDLYASLYFPGYELLSNPRSKIKLDSIIVNNSNAVPLTYRFQYNIPNGYYGPYGQNTGFDYWGYYNGVAVTNSAGSTETIFDDQDLVPQQNTDLLAYDYNPYNDSCVIGNGVRDVGYTNIVPWALSQITYPTGGITSFSFESNQYEDYGSNTIKNAGGYRIHSIVSYPSLAAGQLPITKTYTYGAQEDGVGYLKNVLTPASFVLSQTKYYNGQGNQDYYNDVSTRLRTFSANSLSDLFYSDGSVVKYDYVTEYQNGGTNGGTNGKTVYQYDNFFNSINANAPGALEPDLRDDWMGNSLIKKTEFKGVSPNYVPVHTTSYNYVIIQDPSFGYTDEGKVRADAVGGEVFDPVYVANWNFERFFYQITTGAKRISSEMDTLFSDNNTFVASETDYQYTDLGNLLPTAIIHTNSKGQQLKKVLKYPNQFAGQGNYPDMITQNVLTPVIEEDDYTDGNFTRAVKNSYAYYGDVLSRVILNKKSDSVGGNFNSQFDEYEIDQYNKYGKPLLVKINHQFKAYVYDYSDLYPIAEVVNSDTFPIGNPWIAATSFEADGSGNWNIPSSQRDNTGGITGVRSYNLINGACSRSGLNSSNTYIVSYWSKTGNSYSVSGSTGVKQGKTINGWTCFEHTVTGVASVSVSGSGSVDELRLYPSMAQMTTYTYNPLIGITSQCDVANRITYYEYDGLGRLKDIKDQDGNVIKTYEYHYKQQ